MPSEQLPKNVIKRIEEEKRKREEEKILQDFRKEIASLIEKQKKKKIKGVSKIFIEYLNKEDALMWEKINRPNLDLSIGDEFEKYRQNVESSGKASRIEFNIEFITPKITNFLQEKQTKEKNDKNEYLRKDIKPIFACVGQFDEHLKQSETLRQVFNNQFVGNAENIDYSEYPNILKEKGIKNGGLETYVLSPINSFDKFSRGYCDCTGLVVAGKDQITHENISFISHQDPKEFLVGKKELFLKDLGEHLEEIKKRSEEKTIDVVIVGGNYLNKDSYNENYIQSIKLLEQEILKKLGFYPIVVAGPKIASGSDTIFYDNKNRRVFVGRSSKYFTKDYISKDIEKNKKDWKF